MHHWKSGAVIFKPPPPMYAVHQLNPQYELDIATAVRAEPAKYCKEQSCIQVYTSSDTKGNMSNK